jgi:hypothetical protein
MKKYNKILVLENDSKNVPGHLRNVLDRETVDIEYWYDFHMSFHWDKQKAFDRLMNLDSDTLLVCAPSFAGPDNSFDSYLMIFLKLKDAGKHVDIAVIYPDCFQTYLLQFLSNSYNNALSRKNNLEMLKEVLDFHSLHEITYSMKLEDGLHNTVHITNELLMQDYLETSSKLGRSKCEILETGEVFEVYSVYYSNPICDTEVSLYIEERPNNKYTLKQLKKIS